MWFIFQISKFPKKNVPKKTILSLKFKFPAKNILLLFAGNLNFKLRIVFGNIHFWRFGDLKNESYFWIKATFSTDSIVAYLSGSIWKLAFVYSTQDEKKSLICCYYCLESIFLRFGDKKWVVFSDGLRIILHLGTKLTKF